MRKDMEIPVISVILPCYNAQDFILDAISSIKNQTFKSWELIIVDDCSTDASVEKIIPLLDHRTRLLKQPQNGGYPMAMNRGISQARGEYIARMDADDICLPTRLEEQLAALKHYSEASFCGINRFRITPGGKMYCNEKLPPDKFVWETWDDLIRNERLFTDPSVLLKKSKVTDVGGYRTFQRSGMDVDLWLRVMERFGPGITLTLPLYGKRVEPGSLIFNSQTYLVNQIPRILALQRKEKGSDDVELSGEIAVEKYIDSGDIKSSRKEDQLALLLGPFVTCLWLLDFKGMKIYGSTILKINAFSGIGFLKAILALSRKILERVRHNPYKRFDILSIQK